MERTGGEIMIGAIIGDITGSVYEWNSVKTTDFELFSDQSDFTDDTVLTIATADALLHNVSYEDAYNQWGRQYFNAGYGHGFLEWIRASTKKPYNSFGNGSAMRVSPVGWMFDTVEDTLSAAKATAICTHNHPDGIAGAQSVAAAIFLARTGSDKKAIKSFITERFHYNLDRTIDEIRPEYEFDATCPGSVPEAMIAFLESTDYESAIRLAISLGGDSDTQACIAGSIAEAFYQHIPEDFITKARKILEPPMIEILDEFETKLTCLIGYSRST